VLTLALLAPALLAPAAHQVPAAAIMCGLTAGFIGVSTSWPQAWRLWVGRRHAGLSLPTNVLSVLFTVGWLLYGVASHSAVQISTALVGLVGASAVLVGHVVLAKVRLASWLPLALLGLLGFGVAASLGRTTIGLVATAATIGGVLPQVVLLARAHRGGVVDARGVSRWRWSLGAACNVMWIAYGLLVDDRVIISCSIVVCALSVAVVALASPRAGARRSPETELVHDGVLTGAVLSEDMLVGSAL
jgi:uncharacterized protein with PQ loop repeat